MRLAQQLRHHGSGHGNLRHVIYDRHKQDHASLAPDAPPPKRPPSLKALRDSGRIEEHGDIIALLHRDDYYNADTRPGEADLMIAKCRDGETGRVTLTWRPNCLRFDSHRFGP